MVNVSNHGTLDVGANHTFTVGTLNYTGVGTFTKAGAGTVKVGKEEYVAVRYTATGEVEYFKGADTKVASKTAAKTFQADA